MSNAVNCSAVDKSAVLANDNWLKTTPDRQRRATKKETKTAANATATKTAAKETKNTIFRQLTSIMVIKNKTKFRQNIFYLEIESKIND